jgi:hypothetical protein
MVFTALTLLYAPLFGRRKRQKPDQILSPMPRLLTIDKIRYQWLATTRTYFVDLVFNVL